MIAQSLFSFFIDPVLRAPTIGCMLMCLAASLIGVIVFLRKQSLIGEAISHAAYPGVIVGVIVAGALALNENHEVYLSLIILSGAFVSALLGLWTVHLLVKKMKVASDAALCFVLSTFFGVGLTLTSEVQFSFTALYKQALTYLYGQAATMTDVHIMIYGGFAVIVLLVIIFLYKELQVITFDPEYAKSIGIRVKPINQLLFFLIALAVIIGIRSVGVILMSAMLIAPAVAARQWTDRLSLFFLFAAIFGMASGFFGNYFSVQLTETLAASYPSARLILPTGPMIVLVATTFCIGSLLFAPKRGLLVRLGRMASFRYRCLSENILKTIWRRDPFGAMSFDQMATYQMISKVYLTVIIWRLLMRGWIETESKGFYRLSSEGRKQAEKIIRLHRLWEVYLAHRLGLGVERVHHNAEEMEHILTPQLERELTLLLNDPQHDPHQQPIPKGSYAS